MDADRFDRPARGALGAALTALEVCPAAACGRRTVPGGAAAAAPVMARKHAGSMRGLSLDEDILII
jgi:hypothetical protein